MSTFTAATWNVNHGSSGKHLLPYAKRMKARRVDILILQEVKRSKGALMAFRAAGYRIVHVEPEFAVAWDNARFEHIRHRAVVLSDIDYWKDENRALIVVLRDRLTGELVKVMSYHPPAHVQAPKHVTHPRVLRVLRDAAATWDRIARRSRPACLFAGDDNVDEHKGWSPAGRWDFMLNGPLRQVRAPKPTHGKRRIDDFRVRDLKPVGRGEVYAVGSDHRAFVQTFRYAKESR
jgi:exonuclease III